VRKILFKKRAVFSKDFNHRNEEMFENNEFKFHYLYTTVNEIVRYLKIAFSAILSIIGIDKSLKINIVFIKTYTSK
jgi:hypothetical protein